jgi:hypothetical protein
VHGGENECGSGGKARRKELDVGRRITRRWITEIHNALV